MTTQRSLGEACELCLSMDGHKSLTSQGEKEEIIVNIVVAIHRPFNWLHWEFFSSSNNKVSSPTLPAMMLREKGMAKGREIKFSAPSLSTVWRQVLKYYYPDHQQHHIFRSGRTSCTTSGRPICRPEEKLDPKLECFSVSGTSFNSEKHQSVR